MEQMTKQGIRQLGRQVNARERKSIKWLGWCDIAVVYQGTHDGQWDAGRGRYGQERAP